jgi:NADH dehydrogenase
VPDLHVVTGAFGYTGRHIAADLLSRGHRVRTLTNAKDRPDPFGGAIDVRPLRFDRPDELRESLAGAAALYNTYWVRYDHGRGARAFGYDAAVSNTRVLIEAARRAGVGRLVHISVANAERGGDWGYFRGKALLEGDVGRSGVPHTIVASSLSAREPGSGYVRA